eukprot:s3631_g6.t1
MPSALRKLLRDALRGPLGAAKGGLTKDSGASIAMFRVGPCTLVQRSAIKRWTQARLGEHDQMQQRRKHEQLTAHEPTTAAYTGRQQCIQRVTSFRAFGSLCWSSLQNAKVVLAFYRLLQPP